MLKKVISGAGAILLLLLFIVVIGYCCPIQKITGFPCPGCNMLTSSYWLFVKGDLSISLYYHALLIPTILVFTVCLFLSYKRKNRMRDGLLLIWGIAMIVYYIYRMIYIFPNTPMMYDETSLFGMFFGKTF